MKVSLTRCILGIFIFYSSSVMTASCEKLKEQTTSNNNSSYDIVEKFKEFYQKHALLLPDFATNEIDFSKSLGYRDLEFLIRSSRPAFLARKAPTSVLMIQEGNMGGNYLRVFWNDTDDDEDKQDDYFDKDDLENLQQKKLLWYGEVYPKIENVKTGTRILDEKDLPDDGMTISYGNENYKVASITRFQWRLDLIK